MITSIKAENVSAYRALFEEASDILSGYKRVRTYDGNIAAYYCKNSDATVFEEMYIEPVDENGNPVIKDVASFATALAKYEILYIREGGVAEGYEPMMGITTLEEYFSWLNTLGRIHKKYTKLPLDEEYFDINADTRAINIPPSFKKNGIAVQGDDLAEVVYFKIDRYFDYMDLNNCDIFIKWEVPAPKGSATKTIKSVSPEFERDIESEPGKLIFGWAISDALTAASGTLKFSVVFFQWKDEDKKVLDYSFNTLTASVTIQPSLELNIETDEYTIDEVGARLIERIKNSEIVGGYAAAAPVFDLNLSNEAYDLNTDTKKYSLLVQAHSSDTGAITYTWKKQEIKEDYTTGNIETIESVNVYVEVEDLNDLSKSYNYYKKNGTNAEGKNIYTLYKGTIPPSAEDLADPNFKLYKKQSAIEADSVGIYWAVAENRITNSSNSVESQKAIFPRPEKVVVSAAPESKGILLAANDNEFALEVKAANTDGELSYQWEKDSNYALNFGNNVPVFEPIQGATAAIYTATEPGHYRPVIINKRNEAETILAEVDRPISRITYPANVPVLVEGELNDKMFSIDSLTDINCPTIYLNSQVESDAYTVSWYLGDNDALIVKDIPLPFGTYSSSFNPKNYEDIISEISSDGNIEGSFYARVTNYVNGSQATTEKPTEMFIIY